MTNNLKWNTDIQEFSITSQRKIVMEIIKWCNETLRIIPRFNTLPQVILRNGKKSNSYGIYDSGKHLIIIYPDEQENLRRIIDTVIHEFTHSCQKKILRGYTPASKKFGYKKNPFEVEAREVARENRTACLKHLQNVFG